MNDIIFHKVGKAFDNNKLFSELSFTLPEGQIGCIMGKSGCGKTTILNMIMGFISPDYGEIEGVPNKIATVFQEDRLCEDFSAIDNIKAVVGKAVSEEKISECLSLLGLQEHLKAPVATFSGGMKRRVAIARAILADSELVIMDEPFKGLDDATKAEAARAILTYTAGKTLLVTTHDYREAEMLGGSILNI